MDENKKPVETDRDARKARIERMLSFMPVIVVDGNGAHNATASEIMAAADKKHSEDTKEKVM